MKSGKYGQKLHEFDGAATNSYLTQGIQQVLRTWGGLESIHGGSMGELNRH